MSHELCKPPPQQKQQMDEMFPSVLIQDRRYMLQTWLNVKKRERIMKASKWKPSLNLKLSEVVKAENDKCVIPG